MLIRVVAVGLLSLTAAVCIAQSYPTKPVRIILASAEGGPPDIILRGLAEPLRAELGQPVVIESMPAGDGVVAAQAILRLPPDGYTLMMASGGPITVNPAFQSGRLPYDPQKD